MTDNETLLAEAMLGKDAAEFLATDLGRYLIGCAQAEINEAQELLSNVSPWRRNRIRQLQNQIWRAKSVTRWLAEVISAGRSAEAVLQEHLDEE